MTKPAKTNNPFINDFKEFFIRKIAWIKKNTTHRSIEVAATLLAAIVSLIAVWISFRALKSSNESVALTKESLEISKKENSQNDFVFEEQKKQFESLNRPYIQIELDLKNVSTENDWPTSINYRLKNLGKFPIKIISGYIALYITLSDSLKFEDINLEQHTECLKKMQLYVTGETGYFSINDALHFDFPTTGFTIFQCPTHYTSSDIEKFNSKKAFLYFTGSMYYQSLLDGSNYKYEVLMKIDRSQAEYSCNRNMKTNERF